MEGSDIPKCKALLRDNNFYQASSIHALQNFDIQIKICESVDLDRPDEAFSKTYAFEVLSS